MPATESIEISVNGEPTQVSAGVTLAELFAARPPRPPFAVEVNRQLVRRGEYERVALRAGDRVEIVTLVGGG
ncbi:MAG: sulfur carrier protein ThiS [Phycisphaerae bacterium]